MSKEKVKIVLDADVIIHFAKGEMLSLLPSFLPEYEFVVLDIVKKEVMKPTLTQLENQMNYLKNIKEVTFGETAEEKKEFFRLAKTLGRGESACMVYCRYNHNVVGSSNLRDITDYCNQWKITYLTTLDFLYFGIKKEVITLQDAYKFIERVTAAGSILPSVDFSMYRCDKL